MFNSSNLYHPTTLIYQSNHYRDSNMYENKITKKIQEKTNYDKKASVYLKIKSP